MLKPEKTTIDFPKELPLTIVFKISGVLNEAEALSVISEIKKLKNDHFERFILDLNYTTKITASGLALVGFLIAQSKEKVAVLTTQEKHIKIFAAAGLTKKLLLGQDQPSLTAKLRDRPT
ncbi:MAG: hypothetical protein QNL04_15835 [SAR324 cluster bacterium]|nr:hypothetical protein [SAR324 cluster bacterium]